MEVLKATLSKLQRQHAAIRQIKDSKCIAFLKVDLRLFKRTVLPNIATAISR